MTDKLTNKSSAAYILIKGAKQHNLKNIDLAIPKNKLVVITGLSGSGKSSLAFDTIFAEGQRRYVESLSSYARLFLGKLEKPKVDYIKGIAPAVAIEQKVNSSNPRSTVGTTTEIYDYLKLLFSRIGKTYSPVSGEEVKKQSTQDVLDHITHYKENINQLHILSPYKVKEDRSFLDQLKIWEQQGFSRVLINHSLQKISDLIDFSFEPADHSIYLVIDRLSTKPVDDESISRTADSIETAFFEGQGACYIQINSQEPILFSNLFEQDGIEFNQPTLHFFSFNNPYGACPTCEGYGKIVGIDEDLVIPNKKLSIYENAVSLWTGEKMSQWKDNFILQASKKDFPIHKPYFELSKTEKDLLWKGDKTVKGIHSFIEMLEENAYKIQYRVMLSRYRGKTVCPSCDGKRLRPETNYIKINGKSINDLIDIPLSELKNFFDTLVLSESDLLIAKRILLEITSRLQFLLDVGLRYLTLNRNSNTLSGGESQRINLATTLGSSLVGSIYVLDEPSIGLHARDTQNLIKVLKKLRDLGNTVIVVEHDQEIMEAADHLIDLGPDAGSEGGELCFEGNIEELKKSHTWTSKYLNQELEISMPYQPKETNHFIEIRGARHHNLKNIDVKIPLEQLTVISGMSGSGKSTLVKNILVPSLQRQLGVYKDKAGEVDQVTMPEGKINHIELIDQNPIGKSSRSNPVTYIKAYDEIRKTFAELPLSKQRAYKTKHFSFNVEGGRCETCQGEGTIQVEMQFMADVELICESCNGKRFKEEILEVKLNEKNISDILNMTIQDAYVFFSANKQTKIAQAIKPLIDVGMGYVKMGQSSNTLSGGEAQRIKLASFIGKGKNTEKILFIFDEPSTGLHFHDIQKLTSAFNSLLENGHTILLIEHHPDIIRCANWIIDLGPHGGKEGGEVMFQGKIADFYTQSSSHTAEILQN